MREALKFPHLFSSGGIGIRGSEPAPLQRQHRRRHYVIGSISSLAQMQATAGIPMI